MNLKEAAEFLNSYWYKKEGLITAFIVTCSFSATILASINASPLIWLLVLLTELTSITIIWSLAQRFPKVRKDKIGFVVSIYCNDPDEAQRIYEDFIRPLKRLILSEESGKNFDFIVLPQHLSQKTLTHEEAVSARIKMRAHFMIFGSVKNRTINGKQHHMIDLHGTVTHLPVRTDVATNFTKEFSEFLPRKLQIPTDGDVISLEFTSEWADIVARYIIANAAMFSGDLAYAEQLLLETQEKLKKMNPHFPVHGELNKKIPLRFADLYEALAILHHRAWVEEFDDENIQKLKTYIDKIPSDHKNRRTVLICHAIAEFWLFRNVSKSLDSVKVLLRDQPNEPILHYNLGFLYAYQGNLKVAIRHYRRACSMGVENDALYQIEEFINKVLQLEPEKIQLHYC